MLSILHKGIQYNAPLDKSDFTGDVDTDSKLAYVQGLVSGRCATITADGVALADAAEGHLFIGFIINDAAGYFFENKPAIASGLVPLSMGNQVVVTDQIVTTETFALGDKLYLGSGANAGLVTKTLPVGAGANVEPIGIAGSAASAASPNLTVVCFA